MMRNRSGRSWTQILALLLLGVSLLGFVLLVVLPGVARVRRESQPPIVTPHTAITGQRVRLDITRDTPERLAWEVVCVRPGPLDKVSVGANPDGSSGGASRATADPADTLCEEKGDPFLSGEVAKDRGRTNDVRWTISLATEAPSERGATFETLGRSYVRGSDGRLREEE